MARRAGGVDLLLGDALRVRSIGITTVGLAVRIALATTVSYFVARQLSGSSFVLFAPVTTLLVVQASPFATVGASIQRTFGTGLGVLIATVYVQFVPVNAVTFGIAVLAALLVARLLPVSLASQLQIPVAVVFVLALGSSSFEQDLWRVLDVAIGGVVGILAVYAWPGRPDISGAQDAVDTFATDLVAQLRTIGREVGTLDHQLAVDRKHDFTASSRALRMVATKARDQYALALNSVRLHPRAKHAETALETIGQRLGWLSGIAIQIRALGGAADRLYDRPGMDPALPPSVAHVLLDGCADVIERVDRRAEDAREHAESVRDRIAFALDDIGAERVPVAEVLQSVSLLGRLDLLLDSALRGLPGTEGYEDDHDDDGNDEPDRGPTEDGAAEDTTAPDPDASRPGERDDR